MRGDKTAVYRNELGQELVIDNRTIFLESIDMTGCSGNHVRQGLAGADGQVTVESRMQAKTIPVSLAIFDRVGDSYLTGRIADILTPLLSGTLTVYTRINTYHIDVRPQDSPVFSRKSRKVWKTDIQLVADFPYWRVGEPGTIPLTGTYTVFSSNCVYAMPLTITFPDSIGAATQFSLQARRNSTEDWGNARGFGVSYTTGGLDRDFPIIVDTLNCTVRNASGGNVNQWIDASAPLNEIKLRYGQNRIFCPTGYDKVILTYQRLSQGEA